MQLWVGICVSFTDLVHCDVGGVRVRHGAGGVGHFRRSRGHNRGIPRRGGGNAIASTGVRAALPSCIAGANHSLSVGEHQLTRCRFHGR